MIRFDTDVMEDLLHEEAEGPARSFDEFGEYDIFDEDLFGDVFDEMFRSAADEWDDLDEYEVDYGISGLDDRVRVFPQARNPSTRLFPFSPICYIQLRTRTGFDAWGSGNLVAPRVVLTAGHVLRLAGNNQLRVTPGAAFDSRRPALRSTGSPPSQIVSRGHFRTRSDYAPVTATDYGLIILPRAFNLPRPTRFMPLQARAASRSAIPVTIAGFPGDKQSGQGGTMWRHSARIDTVATADGLLRHPVDTMPGSSGSPIWLLGGAGDPRIQIGVHIGGPPRVTTAVRNIGVRITNAVLAQIASWCRVARVGAPRMWRTRN